MAEYIIWGDEYSVRVDEIDRQHQQIISIINTVFHLVKEGSSEDKFENVLVGLKSYTESHFNFEEEIMQVAGYPQIEEHKRLHQAMVEKTRTLSNWKYWSAKDSAPMEALQFLKEWWVGHIRGTDVEYAPFVEVLNKKI